MPNPQTGDMRSTTRWGIGALLTVSALLITATVDATNSVRVMLIAALVLGVAVGPIVSRCLGTPSLEPNEAARPTLPLRNRP